MLSKIFRRFFWTFEWTRWQTFLWTFFASFRLHCPFYNIEKIIESGHP